MHFAILALRELARLACVERECLSCSEDQQQGTNFDAIFDALPGMYLILDPKLKIVAASDTYLQATMTSRVGIIGRYVFDVFPVNPKDPHALASQKRIIASFINVLESKTSQIMDAQKYDIKGSDGRFEERYWRPVNHPVLAPSGEVLYIINRVDDVTEKQKLAAAEERARNIESLSRAKDEFLAMLSHELRNPLSVIKGWTNMLREGLVDPSEHKKIFDILATNANQQLRIIDDLLDVSRSITGKLHLEESLVNLTDVVEAAVVGCKVFASTRKISVHSALNLNDAIMVKGDKDRLLQVVTNLLSNAIKFSEKGGLIEISLTKSSTNQAVLCVQDHGEGIEESFSKHIFERFTQEGTHATRKGGLGLGLAISRDIVHLHGGEISVQSKGKGHGAAFTVELPVVLDT